MEKIKEVFVGKEKVYLKKSGFGEYRVVYPIKKDLNKKFTFKNTNWKNFIYGGMENTLMVLFIVLLTLGFFYVYYHDTSEMQKVVENPCMYCGTQDMQRVIDERLDNFEKINQDRYKLDLEGLWDR